MTCTVLGREMQVTTATPSTKQTLCHCCPPCYLSCTSSLVKCSLPTCTSNECMLMRGKCVYVCVRACVHDLLEGGDPPPFFCIFQEDRCNPIHVLVVSVVVVAVATRPFSLSFPSPYLQQISVVSPLSLPPLPSPHILNTLPPFFEQEAKHPRFLLPPPVARLSSVVSSHTSCPMFSDIPHKKSPLMEDADASSRVRIVVCFAMSTSFSLPFLSSLNPRVKGFLKH